MANDVRVQGARRLMQLHGVQGVPALVVTDRMGSRLLRGDALDGKYEDLLALLAG